MGLPLLSLIKEPGSTTVTSSISAPPLPGDMRIFSLIVAGLVLLIQLYPGKRKVAGEAVLAARPGSVLGKQANFRETSPFSSVICESVAKWALETLFRAEELKTQSSED